MVDMADVFIIVVTMVLSALFSGIEIAFVSASKLKIELKSAQGDPVAKILSRFVKRTPRVLTTLLVGNNVALVMFSLSAGRLLNIAFESGGIINPVEHPVRALILQTFLSTVVLLVFAEYLPKALFRLRPEAALFNVFTTGFLQFFYIVLSPFVLGINAISHFFLKKILRLKYQEEELEFSKEDLHTYMQESLVSFPESESKPEIDTEMFSNAMELNEIRVKDFMVPRTELQAVPVQVSIDGLVAKFVETGYSKLLVYNDNIDEIVGFVHSSTLFRKPQGIQEVLQPILMVPETMAATTLLSEFTQNRKTIALVVDEFGGTAGLVTVEDLVEEVFGDIEDEHDEPQEDEFTAKQIDENTWLFSARLEVDDLNQEFGLNLPEGEYNTLGGLVLQYAEEIPSVNESVEVQGYRLEIVEAEDNRVTLVKVKRTV
jgi:CBS domain containing-hemolysin-like protein